MRNISLVCLAGAVIATLVVAWFSPDQVGLRRGMLLGALLGGGTGAVCLLLGAWGGRIAGTVLDGTPVGPPWGEGAWAAALAAAAGGLLLGGAIGWATAPGQTETAAGQSPSMEAHGAVSR